MEHQLYQYPKAHQQIIKSVISAVVKVNSPLGICPFETMDLISEDFSGVNRQLIIRAINRGARGDFGTTYRMSYQTIGVWINCEIHGCKPKDLERQQNG